MIVREAALEASVPVNERGFDLLSVARQPLRRLMAAAGVVAASVALAPAAFADNFVSKYGNVGARGDYKVAVVLINIVDSRNPPLDAGQIDQEMFGAEDSVSSYFATSSFGQLQLSGNIADTVEIPNGLTNPCVDDDLFKLEEKADQTLEDQGIFLKDYNNYLFLSSQRQTCTNSNNGRILNGATIENASVLNDPPQNWSEGVRIHELSHQFGLSHANAVHCYARDGRRIPMPLGFQTGCIPVVYQDPFDPMGGARFTANSGYPPVDFDALDKARMGWLKPGNIRKIKHSQSVTIAPDEVPSNLPQLVQIPIGRGKHQFLYIDYRQPEGIDADITSTDRRFNMFGGVTLREAGPIGFNKPITLNNYSNLVDTNPDTITDLDAPLAAGRTYHDAKTGITIKTINVSPEGAEVDISLPAAKH